VIGVQCPRGNTRQARALEQHAPIAAIRRVQVHDTGIGQFVSRWRQWRLPDDEQQLVGEG
jgi:hypothetical protein